MTRALLIIPLLALASCGVPITFGVSTDTIEAEYSAKSGLIITASPEVFAAK